MRWLGEPEIAIEHIARAMRLSPLDPALHTFQTATGIAHFLAGRYAEASSWAEKALREHPNSLEALASLASSNALAGRMEKAQNAMTRLRELSPDRRLSIIKYRVGPFRRPEDLVRALEGARKAGLPE